MSNKIYLDNVDMIKLIKKAYELSLPRGMGHMHYQPGPLKEGFAERILEVTNDKKRIVASMDYVIGRAVKLTVFKEEGIDRPYIHKPWFDHSEHDLRSLLREVGLDENLAEVTD